MGMHKRLLFMEPRLHASLQIVLRRCKNSDCDNLKASKIRILITFIILILLTEIPTCIEATVPESPLKE